MKVWWTAVGVIAVLSPIGVRSGDESGAWFIEEWHLPAKQVSVQPALDRDSSALLYLLDIRRVEVLKLIEEGNLAMVYLPALAAKDLALELQQDHLSELNRVGRVRATAATQRIVLGAWRIDRESDRGRRERVDASYQELAAAITDLKDAFNYPQRPPR